MAKGIVSVIRKADYYVCHIGVWFIAILMFLTTFDVIGRSFFSSPITGTFELSKLMLVIIVLLSIGYVQQRKENVRVSFFADKFSPLGQMILTIVFNLVGLVLFSLMIWQGLLGSIEAREVDAMTDLLHIPTFPFEFLISVGALFASLELLIHLTADIISLATGSYKTPIVNSSVKEGVK
jgi:TRAP-type transport system small permease protein